MNKKNIPRKIWNVLEELGQSFGAYMQANDIDPFFPSNMNILFCLMSFYEKNLNFPSILQKI